MKEKNQITEELSSKLSDLARLATKHKESASETRKIMHDYTFITNILEGIYRAGTDDKKVEELVEELNKKIYKVKL